MFRGPKCIFHLTALVGCSLFFSATDAYGQGSGCTPFTPCLRYQIARHSDQSGRSITLHHNNIEIYQYTTRCLTPHYGMVPHVDLAYDCLANRARNLRPKPFDDVLGNGLPDLVISESVTTGNNTVTYTNMLTIISMNGTNVTETPAVPCTGEIFYFKDFDGDGCMEIVNTDWEQGFRKFDKDGIPMHKGVWKYDPKAGRYRETGNGLPDPPDTWPAYRNAPSNATPPSEP